MSPGDEIVVRRYRDGDETGIYDVLAVCKSDSWGLRDVDFWRWNHTRRPGFTADDVIVAERSQRVVGCFHGAVYPLIVEPALTAPMSFDGDFAVMPECRGQKLTERAFAITDRQLVERRVLFRGGFTSKELNEGFYRKHFGYVFVPSQSTVFRRILAPGPLARRLGQTGERLLERKRLRAALRRQPLVVGLRIDEIPRLVVRLDAEGFSVVETEATDLEVVAPHLLLARVGRGLAGLLRAALRSWLAGRLRVRGLIRSLPRLVRLAVGFARG